MNSFNRTTRIIAACAAVMLPLSACGDDDDVDDVDTNVDVTVPAGDSATTMPTGTTMPESMTTTAP